MPKLEPIVFDIVSKVAENEEEEEEEEDMFAPLPERTILSIPIDIDNLENLVEHEDVVDLTVKSNVEPIDLEVNVNSQVEEENMEKNVVYGPEREPGTHDEVIQEYKESIEERPEESDVELSIIVPEKVSAIVKSNDGFLAFKPIDGVVDEEYLNEVHNFAKLLSIRYSLKRKFDEEMKAAVDVFARKEMKFIDENRGNIERITVLEKSVSEKATELDRSQGLVGDLYAQLDDAKKQNTLHNVTIEKARELFSV